MIEERMAKVPALVAQMRRDDTEFITAETVAMFSHCSMPEAAVALTRLGFAPAAIGTLVTDATNSLVKGGPLPVIVGEVGAERVFTVMRSGRRWTKVPEYLSNGQLTAAWFVDEKTREVRMSEGWKSPKSWPLGQEAAAFVLGIIERFDEATQAAAAA